MKRASDGLYKTVNMKGVSFEVRVHQSVLSLSYSK